METSDLHESTLRGLAAARPGVLILYSRTWEPQWGVLRSPAVQAFLHRYYEFEPEMTAAEVKSVLGLDPVMREDSRGQWIEVFARPVTARLHGTTSEDSSVRRLVTP